jgi:hypothetical protein
MSAKEKEMLAQAIASVAKATTPDVPTGITLFNMPTPVRNQRLCGR